MPLIPKVDPDAAEGAAEREAEYNQLKVALHLAQVDRAHYIEEMNSAMIKMKNTIESLEREGAEIIEKIHAIDSKPNQLRDQRTCEDLVNLAENKDWLQGQINQEKARHAELDIKINAIEKKLKELQIQLGLAGGIREINERAKGKITTLENRLVHVLKTYNNGLGRNMKLRDEIDTLRMQRAVFDQIYRRLDGILSKQRDAITKLIEATTVAYEQREDASQRIQQITEKAEKESLQHNNDMKELVRIIDHDRKLRKFMKIKATGRQEDPQFTASKIRRAQEADDRKAQLDKKIESYEAALNRMLEVIGESNTDNLIESFREKEDRNFALFNYVSETNAKIERLNDENMRLEEEIRTHQYLMDNILNTQKHLLNDMENESKTAKTLQDTAEKQLEHSKENLSKIYEMITDLIEKLDCDRTPLQRRLASSDGVNHLNALDYLTVIEERVNKLLLIKQYLCKGDSDVMPISKPAVVGNNLTPASVPMPNIYPPKLKEAMEEGAVDIQKPYSREELHRRVISIVEKKERSHH
uniref:ODAD1 central coiled coil region domain-containing protein n=1 Tax=Trichobilharzia regenti TaxID=157069 RepID=A0AA85JKX4_TRIRE|nr:unnamed protein product [Trichobilharzia regenti]